MLQILITTFLFSIILVPITRKVGLINGYIDIPDSRKIHKKPKVRIGGVAIYIAVMLSIIFKNVFINSPGDNFLDNNEIFIFILAGSFFFILGLLDDVYKLSARSRLTAQLFASSLIWAQGFGFEKISLFYNSSSPLIIEIPSILSFIITILWITGMTNAINWMDGLDGLAAGLSILSALTFLLIGSSYIDENIILISLSIMGACLGFLVYNLPPSKILMGDGGSYFLGLTFAFLGIISCNDNSEIAGNSFCLDIVTLLIFFVPIFDMSYVILKRLSNNISPTKPDRNHLHHRILDKGFSQGKTTLIILFYSMATMSISLILLNIKLGFISLISSTFSLLVINNSNKKTIN